MEHLDNDFGLHIVHRRGASARPILFVHGQLFDHRCWLRPPDLLPDAHVAMLDLPGHGRSRPRNGGGLEADGVAILEALDALDWPRCDAVGHSLGARALLQAGLQQPQRFHQQLLVAPPGELGEDQRAQMIEFAHALQAGGFTQQLAQIAVAQWYSPRYQAEHPELATTLLGHLRSNDVAQAVQTFHDVASMPSLETRLAKYEPRVSVVAAREDAAVVRELVNARAKVLGVPVHELDGGHLTFEEDPRAFRALLEKRLAHG